MVERSRWGYLQSSEAWGLTMSSLGIAYVARRIWTRQVPNTPSPLAQSIRAKIEEIKLLPAEDLLPKPQSDFLITTYSQIGPDCLLWDTQNWKSYLDWVQTDSCNAISNKIAELGYTWEWALDALENLQPNRDDYLDLLDTWSK